MIFAILTGDEADVVTIKDHSPGDRAKNVTRSGSSPGEGSLAAT
jgi:hypothetical protein